MAAGYAFGWIEGAFIATRLSGDSDIREQGSGNAGASNVTNIMGWRYGALVALIDISKAFLPVLAARLLFDATFFQQLCVGSGVILGHIYPLPFAFRGGKGVASFIGMALALDWRLGIGLGLLLVVITVVTDHIFFASLTLYTALPILLWILGQPLEAVALSLGLTVLGYFKHRSNISAWRRGEETGLRAVIAKHRK